MKTFFFFEEIKMNYIITGAICVEEETPRSM